jgi:hypothetical protein
MASEVPPRLIIGAINPIADLLYRSEMDQDTKTANF